MPQSKIQTLAVVAALSTAVVAAGWENNCAPKYEEYLCDDKDGKEVLTTYTLYPPGCAGYTKYPGVNDWEVWPTVTKPAADPWNTWPAGKDPKGKDPKGKDWPKKHDDDEEDWSDDEDDEDWKKKGKDPKKDNDWSNVTDPKKGKDPKKDDDWSNVKDPKKHDDDDWSAWPDKCKYGKDKDGKSCRPKVDDKWCRGSKDKYGKDCQDKEWNDWSKNPCYYGKDKDGKACGKSQADDWSSWNGKSKKSFGWHNKDYDYWGKDNYGKYYKDYDNNGCDYYGYDKDGKYWKEKDNSGYDCYGYDVAGKYNKYYNYYDCDVEESEWQEWDGENEHKHFNKGYDYYGKNKKGEYKKECDNKGKNFYGYDKDGKYDADCDNKGYDHYGYHKDGHYNKYWNKVEVVKGDDWNSWKGDGKKVVTVTLTETYKVPCSTGWETKTKTIYTTHCGCTETPVPTKPVYSTYTTECPESWGVGKTVTVTVPYGTWTPDAAAATWSTWVPVTATPAATWAAITGAPAKTPEAEKKCDYVTKTYTTKECGKKENDGKDGYGKNEWENCKDVVKTTSTYASTCTWAPWSVTGTPVKGYETATPAAWSPVAVWKGAAPATAVSRGMIAIAGAVAGVVYFL